MPRRLEAVLFFRQIDENSARVNIFPRFRSSVNAFCSSQEVLGIDRTLLGVVEFLVLFAKLSRNLGALRDVSTGRSKNHTVSHKAEKISNARVNSRAKRML